MNRGIVACALLVMTGCGSATPAPKATDEDVAEEQSAESTEPESTEPESTESSAPESAEPSGDTEAPSSSEAASESLSGEDLNAVLQAMLDDPDLEEHLQTSKPGRSPLKISGPDLPTDLKAVKAGYPVKVVDAPKSEKDPVLVLTRVEREGNVVTIAYRFDVDKIRGTTRVKKSSTGSWELMSSRIMQ